MWLKLLSWVYMVDEAEGAFKADGADRTDETDMARMALRMNSLLYFDCLGHKEFNYSICYIVCAYNGLWELCTVTWLDWTGWIIPLRLL